MINESQWLTLLYVVSTLNFVVGAVNIGFLIRRCRILELRVDRLTDQLVERQSRS